MRICFVLGYGSTNDKFISRFRKVEALAVREGRSMEGMTPDELDKLWERAKRT